MCECAFLKKAIFQYDQEITLVELGHTIKDTGRSLHMNNSEGWSWRNYCFKLTRGGHYLVDFSNTKQKLLIENFSSIESIFSKFDGSGNRFGDRDYLYRTIKIDGL